MKVLTEKLNRAIFGKMFPEMNEDDCRIASGIGSRTRFLPGSYNRTRGQGRGILFMLYPYLQELYKNDPEELENSYHRHNTYFLCRFQFAPFIASILYQMEKQKSQGKKISDDSINDVKVALMGPLAGIGDPIFQAVEPMILTGVTLGLALQGSILGPVFYALLSMLFTWFFYMLFSFMGYSLGTKAVESISDEGVIGKATKAASLLGLMMMGYICAWQVHVNLNWTINLAGLTTNVQTDILDMIMPNMLSIVVVFAVFGLMKKGVSVGKIIVGIFVLNIVMALLGMY